MPKKKTSVEYEFSILDDKFNSAIREMNSSLKSMRSQLNLEKEALKSSSASVSDYESKLTLLKEQQELSKKKIEETTQAYERVKKLLGENSIEATKYKDKIVAAKTEQQRITNEIDLTVSALNSHKKALEEEEKKNKELNSSLGKLNATINDQRSKLEELKNEYVNIVLEQGKGSKEAEFLKQEIKSLNKELNDNEKDLLKAESGLNKFTKAQKDSSNESITFGKLIKANIISDIVMDGIRKLGELASKTCSSLKGLVDFALDVGSSFESSMSKVAAISGANKEELEKLTEKAEEMGVTTKFSATESSEALQYMAMAGWKTNEMIDGLSGIMNLAAASGEDLSTTSDIVTDALTAFGMKASESSHFADILAAASSNSNTNVSMMGETFKYAASIAGSLGYSAEDTALAIGLMANAGIKATQAGTSLRSIMSRIATNTNDCRADLEKLGVACVNSDGSMRNFGEVMADLRGKFKDLSEEQQVSYGKVIAGQEALSGFLAIVNSSDEDFNKLSTSINNCGGAAENMAATMLDNFDGNKTLFKSAAEGLGLSIFNGIKGSLNDVVKLATTSATNLSSAFKEKGFLGLAEQLGKEIPTWTSKINAFLPSIFNTGKNLLFTLLDGVKNSIPEIASVVSNILVSFTDLLVSNLPIILESGVLFLIEFTKGISNALPQLTPTIISVVLEIVNILTDPNNLMNLINAALVLISSLAEGIINSLPILIGKLPQIIENIVTFFNDNLDKIIDVGIEIIINLGFALIDSIPLLVENLPRIILAIISGLIQILPKIATIGLEIIIKLGTSLILNTPKLVSKIPQIIVSIVKGFGNLIVEAVNIGKNFVSGLWNGINNAKDWILGKIKGFKDSILNGIKSFFGIHSPSVLMRDEVGKNLALGLGMGFTDEMKDIAKNMQESIPANFDIQPEVSYNSLITNNRTVTDTTDYTEPNNVSPIYLTIENFNNNRDQDIDDLTNEMSFYGRRKAYGKGV